MFSEISIELDLCLMKLERCQPVVSTLQVEFKLLIFCNMVAVMWWDGNKALDGVDRLSDQHSSILRRKDGQAYAKQKSENFVQKTLISC